MFEQEESIGIYSPEESEIEIVPEKINLDLDVTQKITEVSKSLQE